MDLEGARITIEPNLVNPVLGIDTENRVQARIVVSEQKTGRRHPLYPIGIVKITREVR